eukprot:gene7242-biopygen106550
MITTSGSKPCWDNTNGVNAVCNKLGFAQGTFLPQGTNPLPKSDRVNLRQGGMFVGRCNAGEELGSCTGPIRGATCARNSVGCGRCAKGPAQKRQEIMDVEADAQEIGGRGWGTILPPPIFWPQLPSPFLCADTSSRRGCARYSVGCGNCAKGRKAGMRIQCSGHGGRTPSFPAQTCLVTSAPATATGVQNGGQDCWLPCSKIQGPCSCDLDTNRLARYNYTDGYSDYKGANPAADWFTNHPGTNGSAHKLTKYGCTERGADEFT